MAASGATGETTLSGFFLTAFEGEAELNSFQSQNAGVLVTGIDSGAARSVVHAGEIPGYPVMRDSETGRVDTPATGERVLDHGRHCILDTVDVKVRGLNIRLAQVRKSLTSVYDMCAAGHHVVFDFDNDKNDVEARGDQVDWREDLLQVAEPRVGARDQGHPESGNRGGSDQHAGAGCRGFVPFRGAGSLAVAFRMSRRSWDPPARTETKSARASWGGQP